MKGFSNKSQGKETYSVRELGNIFLTQASDTVDLMFKNKELKKMLKDLGIKKLNSETHFELTVYYFWATLLGIMKSSISVELKEALKDAMVDSFTMWTAKMARTKEVQDRLLELLIKKVRFYGETYTQFRKVVSDENSSPLIMHEIGQKLLKNWQHIISKNMNQENVFDTIKFFKFFSDSTIATTQSALEILRQINITE